MAQPSASSAPSAASTIDSVESLPERCACARVLRRPLTAGLKEAPGKIAGIVAVPVGAVLDGGVAPAGT